MEGLSLLTLLQSTNYTDKSVSGIDGALAGSPCRIAEIRKEGSVNRVVFEWKSLEGLTRTSEMIVEDGISIRSATINNNELILTLTNGTTINCGKIISGYVPITEF